MGTYAGKISGIGDKDTRENEITADDLATLRHNIVGYEYGIIKDDNHDFDCIEDDDSNSIVHLTDGIAFAYGYFGYCPAVDITFLLPAVEQYQLIYMEIDKSVIPNACTIKTKNNMSNPYINANTFRQDQLSTVKTGVFQIPLWQIHLSNQGIETLTDLRALKSSIKFVTHSDISNHINDNGIIENNVTSATGIISTNDTTLATTEFVDLLIKSVIEELEYYPIYFDGTLGVGSVAAVDFQCQSNALPSEQVTFTAVCIDSNYYISNVQAYNIETDEELDLTETGANTYTFVMPAAEVGITVYLQYAE